MSEIFGRIILVRKRAWRSRFRNYKVNINGVQQGEIANGNTEEYEVPGGSNEIHCTIYWLSSNSYTVDIRPGEVVYLKVGSGIKYFWIAYAITMFFLVGRLFYREQLKLDGSPLMAILLVLVSCYYLYYLTIGRKSYLKIEEDRSSVFVK